jgi:replicative DNA helicase
MMNAFEAQIRDADWSDPVPFNDLSLLPDFPVDALPKIGRDIVEKVSEVNQVDPALTASLYLAALSVCCAGKKNVDLITHKEPLNIYLCPISDSGNRKSSTTSEMSNPLYVTQRLCQENMAATIRDAQNTFRIKEGRIEKLQKSASAEDSLVKRRQYETEASDLMHELAENPVPTIPVFLVDDVTPEKLGSLMAENGERIAVLSSEGGLFNTMAGKYSRDTGINDLFLKAHAGDYWASHRIGRDTKTMEKPTLTLCLSVQSGVIDDIGKNAQFRERGLLARFLFALCKSQVGYRKRHLLSVPDQLRRDYKHHISSLMDMPSSDVSLTISPDAHERWNEFYDYIEQELRPDHSLYYLPDWGSKLPGAVARIAGLLHLAQHGTPGLSIPISVNSVTGSCAIGAYFKEHAVAVFGLMQEDKRIKFAKQILGYIKRHRPETFKGRDVIHHTAIKFMEDVQLGLEVLMERGYIKPAQPNIPEDPRRRGRPEAAVYLVHPAILRGENV